MVCQQEDDIAPRPDCKSVRAGNPTRGPGGPYLPRLSQLSHIPARAFCPGRCQKWPIPGGFARIPEEAHPSFPIPPVPFPVTTSEDASFVVSLHVLVGSGWCAGGVDAAPHLQAH